MLSPRSNCVQLLHLMIPIATVYAASIAHVSPTASSWQALRQACARSGTIMLSDDFTMGAYDGPINVTSSKEVTIEGGGATLNAAGMGSFFDVRGGGTMLQLSNLTLKNGYSKLVGGAIKASAGASVKIRSSVLANNRAVTSDIYAEGARWGGAIYIDSGALEVHDSMFVNNHVSNPVSLPDHGGAIYGSETSITINNCIFQNNTAEFGGAVYADAVTELKIERSMFTLNHAKYGGALYALKSTTTITSSSFDQNSASNSDGGDADGGALYTSGVTFKVTNSSFSRNGATAFEAGGAPNGGGGGIYAYYSTGFVNSTHFSNNVASGAGAAVFALGSVNITMSSSTFQMNKAPTGGALWADADGPNTALLLGCDFVGNEGRKGANDVARGHYNVGGYDSKVTFGCAEGKKGDPVTMKPGEYELVNPPPDSLKCTSAPLVV